MELLASVASSYKLWSETCPPRDYEDNVLFDLKKMINNPEASDVVLRCSDGVAVHGCRLLLANRCAYFKSTLAGGFSETGAAELTISKFPSPIMISVVEFLYIGKIESNIPVDWQMGFELLCAGVFFMIPEVKPMARQFLRGCMSYASIHSQKSVLIEMLNAALDIPEVREGNRDIVEEIFCSIGPDWVEDEFSCKLSRIAVECILSKRVRSEEEHNEQSVEEYYLFRKIVLWHVYQIMRVDNLVVRQAVLSALPGKDSLARRTLTISTDIDQCVSSFLTSANYYDGYSVSNLLGPRVSETIECKNSLRKMLLHINSSQIPAQLLLKVIHPLGVVPSEQLVKAFVHQAVYRCTHCSVSQPGLQPHCSWTQSSRITASNDGILCAPQGKVKWLSGASAFAIIPIFTSSDVCEWSVYVMEFGHWTQLELGFVCCSIDKIFSDEMLEKPLRWNRSARVLQLVGRYNVCVRQNFKDSPDNLTQ